MNNKIKLDVLERENQFLKEENIKLKETNAIAFVKLAENGTIDEVTASEHSDVFLEWQAGIDYTSGNIVKHNVFEYECLYKCLQKHTSQEGWEPDKTPSLWRKIGDPTEEFPTWSQPIGAGDAYMCGDKVSHNDKHWVSEIDNNVWEPSVYGWKEV